MKKLSKEIELLEKRAEGLTDVFKSTPKPNRPHSPHSKESPGDQFMKYREEHPETHKTQSDFSAQIGSTKSGKPIHGVFEHPNHTGFHFRDHLDAADTHRSMAKNTPFQTNKEHHLGQAKLHTNKANDQINKELDTIEAPGYEKG